MSDPPEVCKIPLRNRKEEIIDHALVSPEDFERVNQHRWHRVKFKDHQKKDKYYAAGGPGNHYLLHIFIMGNPNSEDFVWDHKDINGLHNCRENLREIDRSGNGQNKEKR